MLAHNPNNITHFISGVTLPTYFLGFTRYSLTSPRRKKDREREKIEKKKLAEQAIEKGNWNRR